MGFQKLFKKKSNNRRSKNSANNTGHDNDSINSNSGSLYDRYEINEGVEITTDHYDKVKSIGKVMTKEECNNCGDSTHNNEANNDIMFGSMMMVDDDDDENYGWDTTIPVNEDKYKTSNEHQNNKNDDETISSDEQYQSLSCLEFLSCV